MKKILLILFALISSLSLFSCKNDKKSNYFTITITEKIDNYPNYSTRKVREYKIKYTDNEKYVLDCLKYANGKYYFNDTDYIKLNTPSEAVGEFDYGYFDGYKKCLGNKEYRLVYCCSFDERDYLNTPLSSTTIRNIELCINHFE